MAAGRQTLAQRIQTAWFDKNLAVFIWPFMPLSWLFRAVAGARRLAYRKSWLKRERLSVPVVVVGNLIVGGAGKTPLTLFLAEALKAAGKRPGIISRGYGGADADGGESVSAVGVDSDPLRVGDEPLLLAQRSGVPVFVGRRRANAGRALLAAHPEVNVLICDDGLQHEALARDLEIVVSDQRGFGNGHFLPVGPLREGPERMSTVDAIVVHAGAVMPQDLCLPTVFEVRLEPGPLYKMNDPASSCEARDLVGRKLFAIAGIGHPERFFATLKTMGLHFEPHPFPDHHAYSTEDFSFVGDGVLLMTEKDAVKCRPFYQGEAWVLPVSANISSALTSLVLEKIDGCQAA